MKLWETSTEATVLGSLRPSNNQKLEDVFSVPTQDTSLPLADELLRGPQELFRVLSKPESTHIIFFIRGNNNILLQFHILEFLVSF